MADRLLNRLKVLRAMHDLTQADLAERVRVTRKSINAIERGRFVPSTELALRIAGVFKTSVEDVFQLPDSPTREWAGGPEADGT
ncbi:MAG: helix-turn-helix transcriptional regulator [Acidobacteriota bacterium]